MIIANSLTEELGLGLLGKRLFWQIFTVMTAVLTYQLARHVRGRDKGIAPLAVLILACSPLFIECSTFVMTEGPALSLLTASVLLVASRRRGALCASALMLALASLFRIQSLFFIPGIVLLILSLHGTKAGLIRAFFWMAAVSMGVLILLLAVYMRFPSCLDGMFYFQMERSRLPLRDRVLRFWEVTQRPEFLAGLASAAILLARADPFLRGMGALALVSAAVTTLAPNALASHYYLMILPFCAVCASVLLIDVTRCSVLPWPATLVALVVAGVQAPEIMVNAWLTARADRVEQELVGRIERSSFKTIIPDHPMVAFLAKATTR